MLRYAFDGAIGEETSMRCRVTFVLLTVAVALAGCARQTAVQYRGELSQAATMQAGLGEATATPLSVKVAEKKDTAIASEGSSGSDSGTGSSDSSGSYYARIVPSPAGGVRSTGSVNVILLVASRTGGSVSGAKATVTLTFVAGGARQSKTYTIAADSGGRGSKTVDATPFDSATKVSVSATVLVNGTRVRADCSGYSTVDF